jgi:hypothetical protein
MFRRYLPSRTIGVLKTSELWRNLCRDTELQPEIRDDAITVYYRGGALLRNLRVVGDSITAEVHPKFVPLAVSPSTTSIQLVSETDGGLKFADTILPRPIGLADADVLAAYKELMDQVLVSFPEGQIIQYICKRPENQIVDQEIAFQESGEARDKIDLCHFDAALRKLVFVEVKRKSDPRLFKPAAEP